MKQMYSDMLRDIYIARHVSKKIQNNNLPSGKDLYSCAQQLIKVTDSNNNEAAEDWAYLVDRGGLWHIRKTTFHVFCALQEGI